MNEQRRGEIVLAVLKARLRQDISFRDIANTRRNIGNAVKEPEMVAIHATVEELLELSKSLYEEIFREQLKAM